MASLIDALPAHVRDEIDRLSPARFDVASGRATYILLHGRRDNFIPYQETLALAQRLPAQRVRLFVIDGLIHMDLDAEREDVPLLLEAIRALLAQRR